jgi:hypothetical protein
LDLSATVKRDPTTMTDAELLGLLSEEKEQPAVRRARRFLPQFARS